MTLKRIPAVALAASLAAGPLAAQQGALESRQEGLLEIYQRALQNDPAIREAEAIFRATAEVLPQARSSFLPSLTLGAGRTHTNRETVGGAVVQGTGERIGSASEFEADQSNWSVNLTQSVFDWSQLATLRQADKRVARAETQFELAKEELLLRVADTYFGVLAAEDSVASAAAAREAIGRQLEQAQRRYEVGLIAITDVQDAQAGYDTAVATEIEAQRLLSTAQEFLREIIGEYVVNIAGPSSDLPLVSPDPASAEQWVETALRQNLALISARLNANIAQDSIDIQRGSRLPTLSVSMGYSGSTQDQLQTVFDQPNPGDVSVRPSNTKPEGYNWSLDLRFPLFTGGLNGSRVRQSVYEHRAALEAIERVQRETERATRDSYLGVISDISRVAALAQAVQSAATALRANEAGFEVGTRTTVDVLIAQNQLSRAETDYARSRYDYILNVLRLQQAAGSLSIDDVQQVDSWLGQ